MSKHSERSEHAHRNRQSSDSSPKKAIHRDWRLWLAVALMLGAMAIYVATMDESLQPDGDVGPQVPATAE